jgi:hypothetical protein
MNCREYEADLVELARSGPEGGEADPELRRHLDTCRTCADRLERERELTAGLRSLAERTEVPENGESERRLMAAFSMASAPSSPRAFRHSMSTVAWWTLAAAASLVLLVGSWAATRWPRAGQTGRVATDARGPGAGESNRHAQNPTAGAAPAPKTAATPRAATEAPASSDAISISRDRDAPTRRHRAAAAVTAETSDSDELAGFVALPAADRLPGFDSGTIVRVAIPTASLPAFGLPIAPDAVRTVDADVLVGQDGQARAIRLVSLVGPRREPR